MDIQKRVSEITTALTMLTADLKGAGGEIEKFSAKLQEGFGKGFSGSLRTNAQEVRNIIDLLERYTTVVSASGKYGEKDFSMQFQILKGIEQELITILGLYGQFNTERRKLASPAGGMPTEFNNGTMPMTESLAIDRFNTLAKLSNKDARAVLDEETDKYIQIMRSQLDEIERSVVQERVVRARRRMGGLKGQNTKFSKQLDEQTKLMAELQKQYDTAVEEGRLPATITTLKTELDRYKANVAKLQAKMAETSQRLAELNAAYPAPVAPAVQQAAVSGGTADLGGVDITQTVPPPNDIETRRQALIGMMQGLSLSATAAGNLITEFEKLSLSEPEITRNTIDLNSGLRTVRFTAKDASGAVSDFTAKIDKSGNVIVDTQKRYRNFFSAIGRDVIEFMKWTLAASLVYVPLRKMNDLIKESIELQSSLIDVQIALGRSTGDLGDVFSAAYEIANITGSSVQGVLKGYNEAIAATGGYENEAKRLYATQVLLKDSMILATLAGVDQAEALDVLVGALRQSGLELTEGVQLLDGWVAVSKKANVSINQLATSYAIVATAAGDAGMTFHELNGTIATLAESTKLSADEVGNAIRGFISGIQTDKAEQTLARFGIAVRNVAGEFREFPDIIREVSVLSQQGIIDDKALSEIANAIGGGFRRGAQVATLIENYTRTLELSKISELASGDAKLALEQKTQSLQTAITRLDSAFSSLAQTLGTDGGLLSGFTMFVDTATKAVEVVRELADIMGPSFPLMAMAGVAGIAAKTGSGKQLLNETIPLQLMQMFSASGPLAVAGGHAQQLDPETAKAVGIKMGEGFVRKIDGVGNILQGKGLGTAGVQWNPANSAFGPSSWAYFLSSLKDDINVKLGGTDEMVDGRRKVTPGALNVGTIAAPIAMSLGPALEGNWEKAGVSMAGGLTAGLSTKSGVWGMIGSLIAQAFYDTFLTFEGDMQGSLLDAMNRFRDLDEPGTSRETKLEETERKLLEGLSWPEKFVLNAVQFTANAATELSGTKDETGTMNDAMALQWLYMTDSTALSPETKKRYQEFFEQFMLDNIENGLTDIATTDIEDVKIKFTNDASNLANETAATLVQKAIEAIGRGETGAVAAFLDYSSITSKLATSVGQIQTAALTGKRETGFGMAVPSTEEAMGVFAWLTDEEVTTLTQVSGEITAIIEEIAELNALDFITPDQQKTLADNKVDLENSVLLLQNLYTSLRQATTLRSAQEKMKETVSVPEGLSPQERQTLLAKAEAMWREVMEISGLTDDEMDAYIAENKEKILKAKNEIYEEFTRVPQEYISAAAEELNMGDVSGGNFNFMDLRDKVSESSYPQLMGSYEKWKDAFKEFFPAYDIKEPEVGLILEDGFETSHVDMTILQLALQDLIDIEKDKGLQGIYNLPAGAIFELPMTGFELDQNSRLGMGGGGVPDIDDGIEDPPEGGTPGSDAPYVPMIPLRPGVPQIDAPIPVTVEYPNGERLLPQANFRTPAYSDYVSDHPSPVPGSDAVEPEGDLLGNILHNLSTVPGAVIRAFSSMVTPFQRTPDTLNTITAGEGLTELKNVEKAAINANLSLELKSTTNLTLDGRLIATALKVYSYNDMLRFENASSSSVKRNIIA